jgi:hypothetical protein
LKEIPAAERSNNRIQKFGKMGFWDDVPAAQLSDMAK